MNEELKTIQKLCHDMINMLLSGGCQRDNILLYTEAILELSQQLEVRQLDSDQTELNKAKIDLARI